MRRRRLVGSRRRRGGVEMMMGLGMRRGRLVLDVAFVKQGSQIERAFGIGKRVFDLGYTSGVMRAVCIRGVP